MATTSKYFILPSAGDNFLDLDLSYGTLSLQGQEIVFVGSAAVDMVFLRPGVTLDFTLSGASADKVYLEGNFADYATSLSGSVMTLTRGSGASAEALRLVKATSSAASDQLVFADGTVSSFDLYDQLKNNAAAPIPAGETSLAPMGAAASGVELNANLKAFALDATGETFATARPGMALTLVGSAGVDTVYVPDGASLDATLLGSSTDLIHFRGNWADYGKTVAGSTITFTRTLGGVTESVKVIAGNGGLNDRLIFADGAVLSANAKTALNGDINAAITTVTGYDAATVTPGLDRDAPVLSTAEVNGRVLTLTYSDAGILDATHPPATGDFTVSVTPPGGSAGNVAVTAVAINGLAVQLTLASPVANGSAVTLSYTGSGVNAIQDVSGNDAAALTNQAVNVPSGSLADGYIRDAEIYIDTNGNGIADAAENTGIKTNASGNFFLPPGSPAGTIIAIGGVNIDTGLPNTLIYKAPTGSTTVSPLTTIIQNYVDTNGGTATDAETAVQTALGLPAGVDLLTFDPLVADPADADAVAVQKAATQIATIATLAASAPASGSTATDAANEVIGNLVTTITGAGAGSVNLGNGATATGLLGASTSVAGTDVSNAVTAIQGATTFTGIATAQSMALDTTAPAAPIAAPDLLAASDTGRLNNDDVTQDTTPTLRIRLDITALDGTAAVAGDTVNVLEGATVVGSGTLTPADIANGYLDLTTGALAAGVHSLTARLTDVAGNNGSASAALSLNIDTTAPSTSIGGMALSADTGSSASDGLTRTASQTIAGTLSAALASDERLYGSTDGGATWRDVNGSVSGTNVSWKGVTLLQGGNALALQVRDLAGNAGPTANQAFTLDTTAPAAPGMAVNASVVNVTGLEAGASWEYSTNGGTAWTAGTGTSFTLPAGNYAAGAVQVRQTDAAGNVSGAGSNGTAITLDPPPVFQSATVNGTSLVLNYDEALDGANPPGVGTFTVSVNGSSSAVSAVAVSGSQVTLTLASAVLNGDTVQVGYTDPTTGNDANAIQDTAGNDAASIDNQAVTNNTPPGDTTPPSNVGASFTNTADATITLNFDEAVTASSPAGLTLSLNPSQANGWTGSSISLGSALAGLGTSTIALPTTATLNATDVVRLQYIAALGGDLRDLAGNPVPTGEIWIGGSGDSVIDLNYFYPWHGSTLILRGNAGNDRLVGTANGDILVDGGGADSLTGGPGGDLIRLVENGTTIPYSRDTVRVQLGESFAFNQGLDVSETAMDKVLGSLTSPTDTGFDITSATAANHDVLDLPANQIAANVSHADGIDSGVFARHSVAGGIVTLEDASGSAILIDNGNVAAAAAYLAANFTTPGTTAAFRMDTDGNGSVDALAVFQDNGTATALGNLALPDTVVLLENLAGLGSATLGTTAGANVVQIIDTQAPTVLGDALTGNGFALDFSENAYATTGLALTMLKNGSTAMTITGITGNGTPHLGIVTNQSLTATDWVLATFSGANTGNSYSDASGNALIEEFGSYSFAEGGSGDNSIDLSALSGDYDLHGNAGNDTLIGAIGSNWIVGGTGADTLTGGGGNSNVFVFEQGDSPVRTALNLGIDNVLNTGDTLSFANGIDRITNFSSGSVVGLETQYSDIFQLANAPGFMGEWNDKTPPPDGLATDQGYFAVQGSYLGNIFTVDTTTGTDTLIVWDGDSSTAVTQAGILLSGVTPDHLGLHPGGNSISYVV